MRSEVDDRPTPLSSRSRLTNGRHVNGDGRSSMARRLRDLLLAYLSEVGGEAKASASQKALAKAAAQLTVGLEQDEARLLAGEPINTADFARAAGTLSRTLRQLGVKQQRSAAAQPVDPVDLLAAYCKANPGQADADLVRAEKKPADDAERRQRIAAILADDEDDDDEPRPRRRKRRRHTEDD